MPSTSNAPPDTRGVPIQVALDFVNTLEHSKDADTEHLVDPSSLVAWLAGQGLLDEPERVDEERRFAAMPSEGKKALADARSLRQALRHVVDARVHATAASPRDVAVLNRWLRVPRSRPTRRDPHGLESRRRRRGPTPQARAGSPRGCGSPSRRVRGPGSPPDLRERGVSVGVLRHVPNRAPQVVRHGFVWKSCQGAAAPGASRYRPTHGVRSIASVRGHALSRWTIANPSSVCAPRVTVFGTADVAAVTSRRRFASFANRGNARRDRVAA